MRSDSEDEYKYCVYSSDVATGYGVGALLLLMASQVIIMAASRCFCCGNPLKPGGSRACALLLFIFCWYTPHYICSLYACLKRKQVKSNWDWSIGNVGLHFWLLRLAFLLVLWGMLNTPSTGDSSSIMSPLARLWGREFSLQERLSLFSLPSSLNFTISVIPSPGEVSGLMEDTPESAWQPLSEFHKSRICGFDASVSVLHTHNICATTLILFWFVSPCPIFTKEGDVSYC